MRKIYWKSYFLVLVMLLFLNMKCGHSIKVGYNYNLQGDFLSFKTYDFMKSPASAQVREYVLKRLKEFIKNSNKSLLEYHESLSDGIYGTKI